MKGGKLLRLIREEQGKTQEDWAFDFSVSPAYVGRAERGQVERDEHFFKYLQSIQLKYDSEVLGAFICGIRDYYLQKEAFYRFAKAYEQKKEFIPNYV